MTTWFMDYVAGTDANASAGNGDSFATRRKRIDNFVAAAIGPGDTIRIMGSPAPTSLGVTGVWTKGAPIPDVYVSSSTNASPIVLTFSAGNYTTLAPAVGDTVLLWNHSTNTKANGIWEIGAVDGTAHTISLLNADGSNSTGNGTGGATGTLRKINQCRVKLASAVTKNICLTGNKGTKTNWTASANVTPTIVLDNCKEGAESQKLDIAAAFTTGLAAYLPLGSAVDFSAYQQVSFWIAQLSGTIGADGACTITLCSDAAGATPVNTISIPSSTVTGKWMPVTVDTGGALGASIQSVAFNVVTDNGAQVFLIDHIIACKAPSSADSLNLRSLIGKNVAGDTFFAIQSINSTRVMLDQSPDWTPLSRPCMGYFGTSETVTTYKRETIKTVIAGSQDSIQVIQDDGTDGNQIMFSGGWDATDMSTQPLETWFDGSIGYGYGLYTDRDCNSVEKLAFVRYNRAMVTGSGSSRGDFALVAANNCLAYYSEALSLNGMFNTVSVDSVCMASSQAINNLGVINGTYPLVNGNNGNGIVLSYGCTINVGHVYGSGGYPIYMNNASGNRIFNADILYGNGYFTGSIFLSGSQDNHFYNVNTSGNPYALYGPGGGKNYFHGCTFGDTAVASGLAQSAYGSYGMYSENEGGTAGNHINRLNNGNIQVETSVRHTASGISWKISPTAAFYANSFSPFSLPIAKVACAASSLVTVKLWMRRTNTGLTARLMCKGSQIAGVATDVSTAMTVAADTWEEVTITFTPSAAGVVEILAECWGGTTYSLYVDDFSATQA